MAVIVPDRDYVLKRVAEIEGKLHRFGSNELYQEFINTHTHVNEIIQDSLRAKELEYDLANCECIAFSNRFVLTV